MLRLETARIRQGGFQLEADLEVAAGAIVALIGASGSGKSTLLAAIAGHIPLQSGRILWDGVEMSGKRPGERPVAMIFQDNNLFPHLSAAQNVGLGIDPSLRLTGADRARVAAALEGVGLAGMGERLPAQLSGGQQSRVALARIAVQDKPLILLDEAFSALGPALRKEMLDRVADLARSRGATLLMVTHEPADAARIADEAIVLAAGKAMTPRAVEALLADPPPELKTYLGN